MPMNNLVARSKCRLIKHHVWDPHLQQQRAQGQNEQGIPRLAPDANVAERVEDGRVPEDGKQKPAPDGVAGGHVQQVQVHRKLIEILSVIIDYSMWVI
jgi:hypothetical protein